MKDKYWALILIGIILLASLGIFFTYGNVIEKSSKIGYEEGYKVGYDNKICPISLIECSNIIEDNYEEGYSDGYSAYKKYCNERIDYCFEKCEYSIMIIGGEYSYKDCLWNCNQAEFVKEE